MLVAGPLLHYAYGYNTNVETQTTIRLCHKLVLSMSRSCTFKIDFEIVICSVNSKEFPVTNRLLKIDNPVARDGYWFYEVKNIICQTILG